MEEKITVYNILFSAVYYTTNRWLLNIIKGNVKLYLYICIHMRDWSMSGRSGLLDKIQELQ